MQIELVVEMTDELDEAFQRLIPQLSSSSVIPGREYLERMVASDACSLFIARDPQAENRIVGALTLITFRIPTGVRSWIEDVVVDTQLRGRGVGEALTRAALERARQLGARTVDLTSRPSREAANRLYQRVGFVRRETNLYRYSFD